MVAGSPDTHREPIVRDHGEVHKGEQGSAEELVEGAAKRVGGEVGLSSKSETDAMMGLAVRKRKNARRSFRALEVSIALLLFAKPNFAHRNTG